MRQKQKADDKESQKEGKVKCTLHYDTISFFFLLACNFNTAFVAVEKELMLLFVVVYFSFRRSPVRNESINAVSTAKSVRIFACVPCDRYACVCVPAVSLSVTVDT